MEYWLIRDVTIPARSSLFSKSFCIQSCRFVAYTGSCKAIFWILTISCGIIDAKADEKSDEKKGLFKKKKKDKKDEQIEELNDRLKRQMAEFENFRKRSEKEKSQMFDMGAKTIVEKILPVIDNFERGLAAVPDDKKDDPFITGMDKVYKQMLTELDAAGVKPIECVGQEFDPDFHNAVMQVENDELESGTVAQELQKGYMYKDSVVRHSMVSVVQ